MSAHSSGLSWRRAATPMFVACAVLLAGVRTTSAQEATAAHLEPFVVRLEPSMVRVKADTTTESVAASQEASTRSTPSTTQSPSKPVTPAQTKPAAPSPRKTAPPAGPTFTFQGFGTVGYIALAANQTFDAVLGSSGGLTYGGGATITHRRGYFGRVGIERFSGDGERVFVFGGDVFPLGIPLSVSMTPIDFTGGYRFLPKPKPVKGTSPATPPPRPPFQPARRWVPYVGGGVGFLFYKETSDFAESGDNVDDTFTTYNVLGGFDVRLSRWVGAGGEIGWRFVPKALEDSYLGQQYGEDDLGGLTIRALITVGR